MRAVRGARVSGCPRRLRRTRGRRGIATPLPTVPARLVVGERAPRALELPAVGQLPLERRVDAFGEVRALADVVGLDLPEVLDLGFGEPAAGAPAPGVLAGPRPVEVVAAAAAQVLPRGRFPGVGGGGAAAAAVALEPGVADERRCVRAAAAAGALEAPVVAVAAERRRVRAAAAAVALEPGVADERRRVRAAAAAVALEASVVAPAVARRALSARLLDVPAVAGRCRGRGAAAGVARAARVAVAVARRGLPARAVRAAAAGVVSVVVVVAEVPAAEAEPRAGVPGRARGLVLAFAVADRRNDTSRALGVLACAVGVERVVEVVAVR